MLKLNRLVNLLLCIGLVMVFAGCAGTQKQQSTGEYVDDAAITAKVKTEIFKEPNLKSTQVNVETHQGVVQLSGFVDTAENSKKAEAIAKTVGGVKQVKNSIIVKP